MPTASVRFLADPNQVLWLALAARNGAARPSQMAGIEDATLALDFDLACTVRLNQFDGDQDKLRAKLVAAYCIKAFNGVSLDDDEGSHNNPYADDDTEVW